LSPREYVPVTDKTPLVTLLEGNTPLVPAPRLAKGPDTALESASRPASVPASLDAVLAQLGL
jgi:hypothetical protein